MNDLVLDCLAKLLLEYVPERICPIVEWLLLAEEYRQMGNSKSLHAFEGKVSVVTGAATGMGRQLALGLAKQGARGIALVDVHEEKLKEAASAISTAMGFPSPGVLTITTHVCDVSDRTQVFVTAADVASLHLGQIDALFNNAGIVCANSTEKTTIEEWERVLQVNLFSVLYTTKAFLPYLKKSRQAYVTNTSSMAGIAGFPGQSAYCASKFAVRGITECFMMECLSLHPNIHVCVVHPGMVKTDIFKNCKEYVHDVSDTVNATTLGFTLPKKYRMKNANDLDWMLKAAGSTTAFAAAKQILDGLERKETRILVGTDCKLVDLAIRFAPHGVLRNELVFKTMSFLSFTIPRFVGRKSMYTLFCTVMYYLLVHRRKRNYLKSYNITFIL
jgi:NAD(P)-dependent dehydrogenase (short-subunit alcohol dehydrogenase family)